MNSKTQNIRTKVDKRQIIQYLLLRQRILHNKVLFPTNDSKESIYGCKLREKEIQKMITCIKKDTIDKEIRNMHQYIHRQNDYLKSKKEVVLDKDAILGVSDE